MMVYMQDFIINQIISLDLKEKDNTIYNIQQVY